MDEQHSRQNDVRAGRWILTQVDKGTQDPFFFFEMPYGERKARLVASKARTWRMPGGPKGANASTPSFSSTIATTQDKDGYQDSQLSQWRIQQ